MSLAIDRLRPSSYIIAPLPNMLYTRDTTTWVNDALTLNPLFLAGAPRRDTADGRGVPPSTGVHPAASKIVRATPRRTEARRPSGW